VAAKKIERKAVCDIAAILHGAAARGRRLLVDPS
jgi:hypothetical protein